MKSKTLLKRLKKIGLFRLIFLIVLIASNTFAWFIYATKIDSTVDVHVRAWNVVLEADNNEISNIINFPVDSIYPGMENFQYQITAYNNSEVSARLVYLLLEANILGTEYVTVEGRQNDGDPIESGDLTSAALESQLASDYPFSISFDVTSSTIDEETGQEDFTVSIVWPYENNHDNIDTQWGIAAYDFKEDNPTLPSIFIRVKITISQTSS